MFNVNSFPFLHHTLGIKWNSQSRWKWQSPKEKKNSKAKNSSSSSWVVVLLDVFRMKTKKKLYLHHLQVRRSKKNLQTDFATAIATFEIKRKTFRKIRIYLTSSKFINKLGCWLIGFDICKNNTKIHWSNDSKTFGDNWINRTFFGFTKQICFNG